MLLDEREESIDDGYFLVFTSTKFGAVNQWGNLPAIYHNKAASFAFADDHSEIRRWLDPATMSKIPKGQRPSGAYIAPHDVPWIQERTSARKN